MTAAAGESISLWLSGPFVLLLLLIAAMPLSPPRVHHLWERLYPAVAIGLGLLVAAVVVYGMLALAGIRIAAGA